jgi:serine acetyltransferase
VDKWIYGNRSEMPNIFTRIKKEIEFLGFKTFCQYFFFQRFLRINSDVPWPVHWSSIAHPASGIRLKNWLSYRPGYPVYPGVSIGNYIQAANGIELGVNVRIGPGVKIISADHDVNNYDRHTKTPPVKIGDDVWLGSNSVVLPGVELGDHIIVAAGAVVTKSFVRGNCILAGVPAKIVKELPDYEIR